MSIKKLGRGNLYLLVVREKPANAGFALGQGQQIEPRSDSDSYTAPAAPQKAPLGPIAIYMIQANCLKQKTDRRKLFVIPNAAPRKNVFSVSQQAPSRGRIRRHCGLQNSPGAAGMLICECSKSIKFLAKGRLLGAPAGAFGAGCRTGCRAFGAVRRGRAGVPQECSSYM